MVHCHVSVDKPTTYTISATGLDASPKWLSWQWVRMRDLVEIANLAPAGKIIWTAVSLGEAFKYANTSPEFWFCDERSDMGPGFVATSSPLNLIRVPFDAERLLVPYLWATNVLRLVRMGATMVALRGRDAERLVIFGGYQAFETLEEALKKT